MSVINTNNFYGNISISNEAISTIAGFSALECYGVIDLVSHGIKDSIKYLIKKQPYSRGVVITNNENKITIDIYCVFKYGVSISAVAESLKKSVKYSVENFTGMIVDNINVHVCGVQV